MSTTPKVKKVKVKRFPGFELIPTSHLLDSIWVKEDKSEIKIVFATGQILEFRPLKETEKDNINPFLPKTP